MPHAFDGLNHPEADLLAGADLTPEQRLVWETTRRQLAEASIKARELEKKLQAMEAHAPEEHAAILTRPEFNREVARMLALDDRYGGNSSVLYFDFGRMDAVTARYGKSVSNAASREISLLLIKHVRSSDIVGRLGGDEFGVLLIRCGNAEAWNKAKDLAVLLHSGLAEIHGCKLDLDINYGVYTFRPDEDVATGLKQAAEALTKTAG